MSRRWVIEVSNVVGCDTMLMEAASSTRRSVTVRQHQHVSYPRKLWNFSSPTVRASHVARWMITYLCWDCSLNKHYIVCHVFVAIYVHNFCQNFARNNSMKVGQINDLQKMHHIDFHFLLNCISLSCYTCLKVFRTYGRIMLSVKPCLHTGKQCIQL